MDLLFIIDRYLLCKEEIKINFAEARNWINRDGIAGSDQLRSFTNK